MTVNPQDWAALLEQGATRKCLSAIQGASDQDRKCLASHAERALRQATQIEANLDSATKQLRHRQLDAARLAVLATCSLSAIKTLAWRIFPIDDQAIQVLADRDAEWRTAFAEYLLAGDPISWTPTRNMLKAGLISKPTHINYVIGMTNLFAGVGGIGSDPARTACRHDNWHVLAHLEAEPDLIDDVWRLFEIEGSGEYSLAAHDKFCHQPFQRWDESLVELSRRGKLSRERLLSESLAALNRGFAQFRAGWFSAFHDLLQPTLEERRSLTDRYLALLASPIPPTVSFALKALELIDQSSPIASEPFIDALQPVMLSRAKGTVKSALKLLDKIARRDPAQAHHVARVAANGLTHEASDVQTAALKLIATWGSPDDHNLASAVNAASNTVAASVRTPLTAWLMRNSRPDPTCIAPTITPSIPRETSAGREPTSSAATGSLPNIDLQNRLDRLPARWRKLAGLDSALPTITIEALKFDGTEIPRLYESNRISPVQTLDELIDLTASLIETPVDVNQIERLYDGVSRLGTERPDDFARRTAPLLKRVRDLTQRNGIVLFSGDDPAGDLQGLTQGWLLGKADPSQSVTLVGENHVRLQIGELPQTFPIPEHHSLPHSLALRVRQLLDRLHRGIAVGTLCAPTHAGGWVDPQTLVKRVQDPQILAQATDFEKVLALLRLAPDHRDLALASLPEPMDEFLSALSYALGASEVTIGPTPWLWVAAARSRNPFADDPLVEQRHRQRGPDAGPAARCSPKVTHSQYQQYQYVGLNVDVTPPLPKDVDPRLLSVLVWKVGMNRKVAEPVSAAAIGALYHVWPLALESAFAVGVLELGNNLDWSEARWNNRDFLQPLLDPDAPLKPLALKLLVLGLAAKAPGEHGLASDVAITAIDDGRLDGLMLGDALADLLPSRLIKAARWAKTLENVSRTSELHQVVVRVALARSLRGDPSQMPKDLHAYVELLKELHLESQAPIDEASRQFLQQITGSGKLAQAAKSILAAKPEPHPERDQAIQTRVVDNRLRRAERWAAASAGRTSVSRRNMG